MLVVWDAADELPGLAGELGHLLDSEPYQFVARAPGLGRGRAQPDWRTELAPGLQAAELVLAAVGRPTDRIGYLIGHALGLGRAVALLQDAGAPRRWLEESALAGLPATRGWSFDRLVECILSGRAAAVRAPLRRGSETLLLAPSADLSGAGRSGFEGWRLPPEGALDLREPELLNGAGRVAWLGSETPDARSVGLAGLAGFAAARGLPVTHLMRSASAAAPDLGLPVSALRGGTADLARELAAALGP